MGGNRKDWMQRESDAIRIEGEEKFFPIIL